MKNTTFLNEQISIFRNKMTKVALDLCAWAAAFIREPKHAYAGTFLRTQLGF